jgi:membrane protease YdiL (CAAX protease family)
VHAVLLIFLMKLILGWLDISLTATQINLLCYIVGAVFLLCFLNRYWGASFGLLAKSPFRAIQAVILGFAFYFFVKWGIDALAALFYGRGLPNITAAFGTAKLNTDVTFIVAAVLAPVVEETMFRGALFGTLRTKSRLAAHIVSALVFALFHIAWYLLTGRDFSVLSAFLRFLPASVALAWSYEWSGTIITPVVLHALINLISEVSIRVG